MHFLSAKLMYFSYFPTESLEWETLAMQQSSKSNESHRDTHIAEKNLQVIWRISVENKLRITAFPFTIFLQSSSVV